MHTAETDFNSNVSGTEKTNQINKKTPVFPESGEELNEASEDWQQRGFWDSVPGARYGCHWLPLAESVLR